MWYLPDYSDRYRYSWLQIHISTICGKSQIGNIIRNILKLISSWCRINASLNWVSISSGNGFYWTNAALLSIGPLGTNFNEIRMGTQNFSSMKMLLKMSSAKVAAILSRGRWVYKIITYFRSASCSFLHKIHALPLTFDRRYSRKFSTLELGFHTHTHAHAHTHFNYCFSLQWRHNGRDGVPNHRRLDCLLNSLIRRRSKKLSRLCFTGLCEWNSPVTGEFPAQRASNAENVPIWWRHHGCLKAFMNSLAPGRCGCNLNFRN